VCSSDLVIATAFVTLPLGTAIGADQARLFGGGADLTSTDTTRTTLGVRGHEASVGTAKISHEPSTPGATDPNASALSLRSEGVDTLTQGIFYDAPNSDKVKVLNLRVKGREVLTLAPDANGVYVLKVNGKVVQTSP